MNDTNNKDNITIGLPRPGGAVYWAPLGTTLPENADDDLGNDYVNLGYISEDGVTLSTEESIDKIRAWGRDVVMVTSTEYSKTVTLNFLETIRESTVKYIRGAENVDFKADGTVASGETGDTLPRGVIVIDTLQNNGAEVPRIHRIVFGDCQISDRSGDQTFNNSDPLVYPAVIEAFKFDSVALPGKQVYCDDFWTAAETISG